MERTSKKIKEVKEPEVKAIEVVVNTKLRWQKIGGGSLRWHNQIIKPGQVFEANLEELPKSFMDTLVCIDKETLKNVEAGIKRETQTVEVLYKLAKSKISKSHWDVVNEEGKPLNEKPLEKEGAEELLLAVNS